MLNRTHPYTPRFYGGLKLPKSTVKEGEIPEYAPKVLLEIKVGIDSFIKNDKLLFLLLFTFCIIYCSFCYYLIMNVFISTFIYLLRTTYFYTTQNELGTLRYGCMYVHGYAIKANSICRIK